MAENENGNSVAKVIEISARSTKSFEDAIQHGITRATATMRNVAGAWIKDQRIEVKDNKVTSYQVNLAITFELDDK